MRKSKISALLLCVAMFMTMLTGCGSSGSDQASQKSQEANNHITVYLWETRLFDEFESYVKEQCPGVEIEFIAGNNNIALYEYLAEHGELPDIITTRRFSQADARELRPYLMDFSTYDVLSSYYPYAMQYYTDTDGGIYWLPICGIPETMIANKTLFDKYGIAIPENYKQFADACKKLQNHGVKPYCSELSKDWAAHSLLQGAALDQFSSLKGIEMRHQAENAEGEIIFQDELWTDIFREVNRFIKDTGLDATDRQIGPDDAKQMFIDRKAAIFRGTPVHMVEFQSQMKDELVRLPYFSQTSDESWIYSYPSLNLALNRELEEDKEKLDAAVEVTKCFLSQKGQEIISAGQGLLSYNVNVKSNLNGMTGIEEEIKKNAFYIRYASGASFSASLLAVNGLLTGEMDEQQALDAFKNEINKEIEEDECVVEFQNSYSLAVNKKGGRDAASSMLTTIRKENGADLAFTPYYYYTSSIYKGGCTQKELDIMLKNDDSSDPFILAEVTGKEVRAMIEMYLKDTGSKFCVTDKYELPIASGMKLILKDTGNGYQLKNITVDGISMKEDAVYKLLITTSIEPVFKRACPNHEALQPQKNALFEVWSSVIGKGQQPAEPEDYIAIE